MSSHAPPFMLGEETSRTPPSQQMVPVWSVLKLFLKCRMEVAVGMAMPVKARAQSLIPSGSGTNASLGGESGSTVEIVQQLPGIGPGDQVSKFSLKTTPPVHGVAVAVGVGLTGGPSGTTRIGSPVLVMEGLAV